MARSRRCLLSWTYLRDLFCLLPSWPKHRVLELAPVYWNATSATDEMQVLLAADPFRALTLDRKLKACG